MNTNSQLLLRLRTLVNCTLFLSLFLTCARSEETKPSKILETHIKLRSDGSVEGAAPGLQTQIAAGLISFLKVERTTAFKRKTLLTESGFLAKPLALFDENALTIYRIRKLPIDGDETKVWWVFGVPGIYSTKKFSEAGLQAYSERLKRVLAALSPDARTKLSNMVEDQELYRFPPVCVYALRESNGDFTVDKKLSSSVLANDYALISVQ